MFKPTSRLVVASLLAVSAAGSLPAFAQAPPPGCMITGSDPVPICRTTQQAPVETGSDSHKIFNSKGIILGVNIKAKK